MLKILLLSLFVFGYISAQFAQWDEDLNNDAKDEDDMFNHCNESFCNKPCFGAKRPPYCPIRLPLPEACPSNCACMINCERHSIICFELQDCLVKRRTFTRRRRVQKA